MDFFFMILSFLLKQNTKMDSETNYLYVMNYVRCKTKYSFIINVKDYHAT